MRRLGPRWLSILLVSALSVALAACTSPAPDPTPTARPVTTEEAQLLSIARFTSFDVGSRPFSTDLRVSGAELSLRGWVDYASGVGYAAVTGNFVPQVVLWSGNTVGLATQAPDPDGFPVLPIPPLSSSAWQSRPIDAGSSALDAALTVIGNLGQDRPDNPLLMQQSGALWLKADTIDGTAVTVFGAPPSDEPIASGTAPSASDASLRLWVDGAGLILRAELRIDNGWTTVEFPDAPAPRLTLPAGSDG